MVEENAFFSKKFKKSYFVAGRTFTCFSSLELTLSYFQLYRVFPLISFKLTKHGTLVFD